METEQYTFVHILDPGRADGAGDGDSGVRPGSAAPGKEDRLAILALALVPGGSPTSVRRLVRDHAPATVVRAPANLLDNADLTDQDRAFLERLIAASPERLMVEAARQGDLAEQHSATILTFHDPGYPSNLREVGEAPPVLFVQGTLDAEKDSLSAAVVGTREASGDGLFRARKVAKMLVERDVVVVSGLARGIDTAAHRATLDAGGRTVAVVGCGLDRTYPPENVGLADAIAEHGAIVSQFPFGSPPTQSHFPLRNKTMALLSLVTIVVEAGPTSGAKMQANFALRMQAPKRHVFLMDSLIKGQTDHAWVRDFLERGAQPLRDIEDVLHVLPGWHAPPPDLQMRLFL